jgi:hypothetical protein
MLEAQPISEEPKEDVPFGIRAIESGIEVDGVWISRSNTPVGSSRSSITEAKAPRSYNSSQLELPKAIHGSSSRSSLASSFDRAVSAERIRTNESRSSSPGHENPASSRGRPPVASSSRYSNPNFQRNSSTLQALEGLDPASSTGKPSCRVADMAGALTPRAAPKNGQNSSSNSGKSSARTSDESDYMAIPEARPYDAAYINPKHTSVSVPADPRTDLNLLQSHRLSHVAETGQLTPRVRRPGNSGDWASGLTDNIRAPQDISTANGVDYFVPRQKTSSPPLEALSAPPKDAFAPSGSRLPQDSQPLNQTKQSAPVPETYAPQLYQPPQTYQPRGPQYETAEGPSHQEVQTAQTSQRQSQVLRKVNSGFEILRPGTFGEPPSLEEDKPVTGEKRKSKRLQKRRTSSSASRTSHFVEQV